MGDSPLRSMPDRDDIRLDYEKTIDVFKLLADIRFKLLALVPSVVGAAVGLMSNRSDPQTTFAVAALGLVATLGVLIYELRNSHLYNWTIHRAKYLESKLQLPPSVQRAAPAVVASPAPVAQPAPASHEGSAMAGEPEKREEQPGGLFTERPAAGYQLFQAITVQHDRGLAFVYAAALAGWAYLLIRGGFSLLGRGGALADALTLLAAACVGVLVGTEVVRHDRKQNKPIARDAELPKPAQEDCSKKKKRDILRPMQGVAASLLVAAIVVFFLSPRAVQGPTVVPSDSLSAMSGAVDRLAAAIAANSNVGGAAAVPPAVLVGDSSWTIFGLATLAVVVGALLFAFGKGPTRAAGAAAMIGGLTANGTLVRDLKLESLVKLTNQFDVKAQIEAEFGKLGTLGSERLLGLDRFVSGTVLLEEETTANKKDQKEAAKKDEKKDDQVLENAVAPVCDAWHEHEGGANRSLLIVVGATDRVPLTSGARRQYESNFGLARARAERVKKAINHKCRVPADNLLALVSGPRTTPDVVAVRAPAGGRDGYPADRSVEVWAFWSLPPRKK